MFKQEYEIVREYADKGVLVNAEYHNSIFILLLDNDNNVRKMWYCVDFNTYWEVPEKATLDDFLDSNFGIELIDI